MTVKKSWKAEYWPQIIELLEKENETKKNTSWPYVYDYTQQTKKHIEKCVTTTLLHSNGSYVYINSKEIMQVIVSDWDKFNLNTLRQFRRTMKPFENKYILKAIYNKRKEEFDALVAKNDN